MITRREELHDLIVNRLMVYREFIENNPIHIGEEENTAESILDVIDPTSEEDENPRVVSTREQAMIDLSRKIDKVVELEIEAKSHEDQYIFHTSRAEDFRIARDKCSHAIRELNAVIDEQFAGIRRRETPWT